MIFICLYQERQFNSWLPNKLCFAILNTFIYNNLIITVQAMHSFTILLLATTLQILNCTSIVIPLTYCLDPNSSQKYPVKFSFNSSITTTPFSSQYLPLYNTNITMQLTKLPAQSPQQVTIGLKSPSIFLSAIEQTYKVQSHQIQLGKNQYTQLIINDNNFVQSTDMFMNGDFFNVQVMYNYGDKLNIGEQRCWLIDDDGVYFDQFLILEILNTMDKRNKITFKKDQTKNIIQLQGSIDNFPKISFIHEKSIFQISISTPILKYLPRQNNNTESVSFLGYKSLSQFSKFQIDQNKIVFKRTSQLYQLYLFLGYFFVFTLLFIIYSKDKFQGSMKFISNVISWVVFGNNQARVEVLRIQMQ